MIELDKLSYSYEQKPIIDEISFMFQREKIYGVIGPNGTGKSTLVQLIAGLLKPKGGQIKLNGKPIQSYKKKQLAQMIAVLQQGGLEPIAYTVDEVLSMARYPYQGFLGFEQNSSEAIIEEAITRTNIAHLRKQRLHELSGGERQRVALAKLWVQRPQILILDEPTTYLDIGYQQMIMDFISQWQKEEKLLVIAVLHDINLAALYCEAIIALNHGKIVAQGKTEDVLNENVLNELFHANIQIIKHPELHIPQMIMK